MHQKSRGIVRFVQKGIQAGNIFSVPSGIENFSGTSHVCITCLCSISNHLRETEQTAFESLKEKWGCVVVAGGRVAVSSPASL